MGLDDYSCTYAGTPFITDVAKLVRMQPKDLEAKPIENPQVLPPRDQQPLADLLEEIDRKYPFQYLRDFDAPDESLGRNLQSIARPKTVGPFPNPTVKVGDFFYPTTAQRWSVFRGLATTEMVEAMLEVTEGFQPAVFYLKQNPLGPTSQRVEDYQIATSMFMLPPRILGETLGFSGLYLVTLVDERYFWQYAPVSLRVKQNTTWASLITQISTVLGVPITYTAIESGFVQPEPDSQLWTNSENAASLLDAIAYNLGRVVVRNLDGTYVLQSSEEAVAIAETNIARLTPPRARLAGGDLFKYEATRNSVLPENFRIVFPKYVAGDDPVPHFLNTRYSPQRQSAWFEESYGEDYEINITLTEGVPGYTHTVRDTAKALYLTEADAGGDPTNLIGLQFIAELLSVNFQVSQTAFAIDEVFPGIFAWTPDCIHDLIWRYSARTRQASLRVARPEWNQMITHYQHATPPPFTPGQTNTPKGVGGPSVAQTWRDSFSGDVHVSLASTLNATASQATFGRGDYLPTQNRWKGLVDSEIMLFEGTSGGLTAGIVQRGIDGTLAAVHANGSTVTQLTPDTTYGVNLITSEKMQWIFPSNATSGGITGVNIVPQTQSVYTFSASGELIDGILHYSGEVEIYDSTLREDYFPSREKIWIVERNEDPLSSGKRYDGQFAGFSKDTPKAAPIYLVNESIPDAQPEFWVRLLDRVHYAYAWEEWEPAPPSDEPGLFATDSGKVFKKVEGGRNGSTSANPIFERNKFPNVPIGSFVLASEGAIDEALGGQTYIFDYDYDHFPAELIHELGGGEYRFIEQYPPQQTADNPRGAGAETGHEFNDTEGIEDGTVVKMWVYKVGDALEYWFGHCCTPQSTICNPKCPPLLLLPTTDVRCESGSINIYTRNQTVACDANGCLISTASPWTFDHQAGTCSGTQVVSGTTLLTGATACCSGKTPLVLYAILGPVNSGGCDYQLPSTIPLVWMSGQDINSCDVWLPSGSPSITEPLQFVNLSGNCYGSIALTCCSGQRDHSGNITVGSVFSFNASKPDSVSCDPFQLTFSTVNMAGTTNSGGTGASCCSIDQFTFLDSVTIIG